MWRCVTASAWHWDKPYHGHIIEDDATYIKDDVLLVRMAGISVCKYVLNIYNSMSEENKVGLLGESHG